MCKNVVEDRVESFDGYDGKDGGMLGVYIVMRCKSVEVLGRVEGCGCGHCPSVVSFHARVVVCLLWNDRERSVRVGRLSGKRGAFGT